MLINVTKLTLHISISYNNTFNLHISISYDDMMLINVTKLDQNIK